LENGLPKGKKKLSENRGRIERGERVNNWNLTREPDHDAELASFGNG
jgi:hypothetical protein